MPLDIIALVLIGLASLGASVLVLHIVLLTLDIVIDWFKDRVARIRANPRRLAVTVAEQIAKGNVSYVQGIFDTNTSKFVEARRIRAKGAEAAVKHEHRRHKVAVWA
jgi:hypothetical protein